MQENGKNRVQYEFVYNYIKNTGYTLLTPKEQYKDTRQKLTIQCPKNDIYECSFHDFKDKGVRCSNESCILERRISTNQERYGTNYHLQNETIREKAKQTLKENYDVDYPSQSKIIQERIRNNNIKERGFPYVFQDPEVRANLLLQC